MLSFRYHIQIDAQKTQELLIESWYVKRMRIIPIYDSAHYPEFMMQANRLVPAEICNIPINVHNG